MEGSWTGIIRSLSVPTERLVINCVRQLMAAPGSTSARIIATIYSHIDPRLIPGGRLRSKGWLPCRPRPFGPVEAAWFPRAAGVVSRRRPGVGLMMSRERRSRHRPLLENRSVATLNLPCRAGHAVSGELRRLSSRIIPSEAVEGIGVPPRVSIATLIAVVGVLAVDCSIWREECYTLLPPVDSTEPFIWTVIPIMSALTVGGLSLARQVVRRDEGHPFLLGFEAVGGIIVMALIALHWAWGRMVDAPLRVTKDAVDHLLRGAGLIKTMGDYYTPVLARLRDADHHLWESSRCRRSWCRSSGAGCSESTVSPSCDDGPDPRRPATDLALQRVLGRVLKPRRPPVRLRGLTSRPSNSSALASRPGLEDSPRERNPAQVAMLGRPGLRADPPRRSRPRY